MSLFNSVVKSSLLCLSAALMLAACVSQPPRDDSLYRDLGGQEAISAFVEDTVIRLLENPRIAHLFADVDLVNLHQQLVSQICYESGGPCEYTGRSMEEAHSGLAIDEGEFNALVEDLIDAMEARKVPISAQNRLLARLAPMRERIIHR